MAESTLKDLKGLAEVPLRPLVVDLDGTIINSDLLLETASAFLVTGISAPLQLLRFAVKGRAHLKAELADRVQFDPALLPYRLDVLSWLKEQRASGRRLVLASASDQRLVEQVAEHLGLFDEVLGSHSGRNLKGRAKGITLVERFGERGFDYVGDSAADVAVWRYAHTAHLVGTSPMLAKAAERSATSIGRRFESKDSSLLRRWTKALRLHQWAKNVLLFVPLLAAHRMDQPHGFAVLIAFICFGLCSSSVYLLNDLVDVREDRLHRSKKNRPFASGQLSLLSGWVAVPVPLALSFASAILLLPSRFTIALGSYYFLTLAYSLWFKRMLMIDVVVLALLYAIRVVSGGWATATSISFWLMLFCLFMFTSLAMVKRYTELRQAKEDGREGKLGSRDYRTSDLEMLAPLGAAAGCLSVMVLALYIQDPASKMLYRHPNWIWAACPILQYWIARVWLLAHRGEVHDDPVLFALKDRTSLVVALLLLAVFAVAR